MSTQQNETSAPATTAPTGSRPGERPRVSLRPARRTVLTGTEHAEVLRALTTLLSGAPAAPAAESLPPETLLDDQPRPRAA